MTSRFDNEIRMLDNEIKALKSAKQKMFSMLKTTPIVVPVQLKLVGTGSIFKAEKTAVITLTPYSSTIPLVSNTIDVNSLEKRSFWYVGGGQKDGTFRYEFWISNTDNTDDYNGRVLNFDLVFISTSQMDVSVTYEEP